MPISLFDFQTIAVPAISKLTHTYDNVLCVSPGGSGKTVIISVISQLYVLKNTDKKVCVFVHRDELFNQTREKLLLEILYQELTLRGIVSQGIDANTDWINPNAKVYVIMVETFNRRAESENFLNHFKDVGLYFIDECHRTDFYKIFKYFTKTKDGKTVKRLGFTATPISADKKHPLKDYYQVMYEIAKVSQLQALNLEFPNMGVVPSVLYHLGKVDRGRLKMKGDEFDETSVSNEFSKDYQIENTIEAYQSYARGMKTLCFDADVDHSIKMMNALRDIGVDARHVNGGGRSKKYPNDAKRFGKKAWRRDCLEWLKYTQGACLNNVGILTTGFDEPSVENIIINSSMISLSLYIQKMVRGSRPFQYSDGTWKENYLALDMGCNASPKGGNFGDCNLDIDWEDFFNNPNNPNRNGVGGSKICPNCGQSNSVSARFCSGLKEDWLSQELTECGYIFSFSEKEEDLVPREMIRFFTTNISIKNIKRLAEDRGWSDGKVYYETLNQIANLAFKDMKLNELLDEVSLSLLFDIAISKIKELSKSTGRRRTIKDNVKRDLISALRKVGFIVKEETEQATKAMI